MKLATAAWLMILCGTLADAPGASGAASQPAVGTEVARLIEQLGDLDFHVRTAAFKRLKAIGRSARAQLKATRENSKDAEIVYRCKQLLAVLGTLDVGVECARTHPAVAEQLKKIAKTYPDTVAGLGGSGSEQELAISELGRMKHTVEVLVVLDYWATRIKDKPVRRCAEHMYISRAASDGTTPILVKHADLRRRLIKFVYADKPDWSSRQRRPQRHAANKLLVFEESVPFFVKQLMKLRRDDDADLGDLCGWLPIIGVHPKLRRQLVPVAVAFLDDKRTVEHRQWWEKGGKSHIAQIADYALLVLHRTIGKKWTAGLPRVPTSCGYFTFKTDAVRQKYIAAFRAWYKKNRDKFAPDPATRPATQPATRPATRPAVPK